MSNLNIFNSEGFALHENLTLEIFRLYSSYLFFIHDCKP